METDAFTIPKRIDSIQALRCFLALGVFLSHFEAFAATGIGFSMPVYIFYTLSGFFVMLSTQSAESQRGFLRRRLIRLLPLYWLVTLFTFALSRIAPKLAGFEASVPQLIKSMLCLPFSKDAMMTGGERLRPLVGTAHTLEVEVLFTLIFAVCLLINKKHRGKIAFAVCAALFAAGETSYKMHFHFRTDFSEFYIRHSRAAWLYFAAGILIFAITKRMADKKLSLSKTNVISAACISAFLVFAAGCVSLFGKIDPDIWLIAQALTGALLITGLIGLSKEKSRCPRLLVIFGDMSFSFFLLHYYAVKLAERLFDASNIGLRTAGAALFALCLSLAAAAISHELIEKRLTRILLKKALPANKS